MTPETIRFEVRGIPSPQGALKIGVTGGRSFLFNRSKALGVWRQLVASEAQRVAPAAPWTGPVAVLLEFYLPLPKRAPKRRRVRPDRRPDLDKLVRAVLDAITAVLIADDSQVVEIAALKDYGPAPGVRVGVARVTEDWPPGRIFDSMA